MIRTLRLHNFKCFENQGLAFSPLTLLSGLNGTGKSSVLQALLLLRQSYQQGLLPHQGLALHGDWVRLGTAKDALFEGAQEETIGFDLDLDGDRKGQWRFNYNREADVLDLASPPVAEDVFACSLFDDHFHYLQAERIGPRTAFDMSDFLVRQHRQLGTRGEYAAHFLARIIHQPQKSTRESAFEVRIALRATASPDHPDPKTSPSGCPGSAPIGRPVAIGHTASSQPAWAYNEHLALEPSTLSMELTGFARSDARRPTRSNCASKPAPPGTTRATIS